MSYTIQGNHTQAALSGAPIHVMAANGDTAVVTWADESTVSIAYLDAEDWDTQVGTTGNFTVSANPTTLRSGMRSVADASGGARWLLSASTDANALNIDLFHMNGATSPNVRVNTTHANAFAPDETPIALYTQTAGVTATYFTEGGQQGVRAFSYSGLAGETSVIETTSTPQTVDLGSTLASTGRLYASGDAVTTVQPNAGGSALAVTVSDLVVAGDTLSFSAVLANTVSQAASRVGAVRVRPTAFGTDVVAASFQDGDYVKVLLCNTDAGDFQHTVVNTGVVSQVTSRLFFWPGSASSVYVVQLPAAQYTCDVETNGYGFSVLGSSTDFDTAQSVLVDFNGTTPVGVGIQDGSNDVFAQTIESGIFGPFESIGTLDYAPQTVSVIQNAPAEGVNDVYVASNVTGGEVTLSLVRLTAVPVDPSTFWTPFNNTLVDVVGGISPTYTGPEVYVTGRNGTPSNALFVDPDANTGQYATTLTMDYEAPFSMSLYFKMPSTNGGLFFGMTNAGFNYGMGMRIYNVGNKYYLRWNVAANNGSNHSTWLNNQQPITEPFPWIHLVVTYDGTPPLSAAQTKIYFNKVSQPITYQLYNGGAGFVPLPNAYWNLTRYVTAYPVVDGLYLQDLKLYDVVLTQEQIDEL